jgi:hypothetical protein
MSRFEQLVAAELMVLRTTPFKVILTPNTPM